MKKSKPKPRHTWQINPKTRVAKSKKIYSRTEEKKRLSRRIADKLDWFGEKK